MPHLRPALPSEAEALTDLCLRAKAVWGYDEAFMAACRARLARTLVIESDPGAAPFYIRMGANQTGEVASGSIPGRRIPRLEFYVG